MVLALFFTEKYHLTTCSKTFFKLNYVEENIILPFHYFSPTEVSTSCRSLYILNRAESYVL